MNRYIVILLIIFLGSCATKYPCSCPKGGTFPIGSKKQKPSAAAMIFPVVVYTYDLDLLSYTNRVIDSLNSAFSNAEIQFELKKSVQFDFPEIDKLTNKGYKNYYELSELLDENNSLGIWIVPPGDVCNKNSCAATKGFSNINGTPNNIVLSQLGWINTAVVVHEMGHWFGLQHTTDDNLDDTPYDPGSVNSVYISYDDCEMYHPKRYKPMIENFMSYYEHCPNRRKTFTPMQYDIMKTTAWNYKRDFASK